MKTLAVYNMKGGVGKTASAVNFAYLAARENIQTLLIDLDPQGSASFYFKVQPSKKFNTKKFLKSRKSIDKNIKGTDFEGLDLLAADISYRNMDIALNKKKRSQKKLKGVLKPLKKEYDLIILDCPPNITLLSENIFFAADHIIVPTIPTTLSIVSLYKLQKFFVENSFEKNKLTPFFSMVEKRKTIHRKIIQNAEQENITQFKTHIPFSVDIEKMGVFRQPAVHFCSTSTASKAYSDLWAEIKELVF
jgi:cellulose biosynthesis protein BcsQ